MPTEQVRNVRPGESPVRDTGQTDRARTERK